MNGPSRVHWVGLQALHWPPSVLSALMLGHARNVHTYGYKHKHSGTAWNLVAGYLTFLTWKTSANIRVWSSPEKLKRWLFCQMPKMTYVYDFLTRTCELWLLFVRSIGGSSVMLVSQNLLGNKSGWMFDTSNTAVGILFTTSCKPCFI